MKGAVRAIITKNRIGNLVQKCKAAELGAELAARGEAVVSVAEARSLVADAGDAGIARLSECIAVQPRPNYVTAGETAERLESQPASRTASEPEEESTGASSSKVSCATLPPN